VDSPEAQRTLLEIPASATLSADLVRRQFQILSERYNPEKVAAMGPEFVTLAKSKHEAIRAAAISLLDAMGEKLETDVPPAPAGLRDNPDLDAIFGA
jgi:hypothetical protein